MPIYKGTLKTGAAYKGSTSLSRIYKGIYLVFEAFKTLIAEGVPPLTLLNCAAEIMLGYRIYGDSRQKLLPAGYTQIEYIEATGTQYIDTGFSPDGNTKVDYKVETTAGEYDASPFIGARVGSTNTARFFPIAYNNTNGEGRTSFGSKTVAISNVVAGTVFEGSFDPTNGISTINGTDYDISGASFQKTDNYNLYLFATTGYVDNLYLSHGKMYYCKIYDNGTLVRSYIPAKNSSNVVGMYDLVNGVFYQNAGTGSFTAGANAPTPNAPIEIESVGDKTKNLWNSTLRVGCMKFADGQYLNYQGYVCNTTPIPVEAGETYTISANNYDDPDQTSSGFVFYNNGSFVRSLITTSLTVTIPSGANQLYYNFRKQSDPSSLDPSDITNVQLEKGSSATSYEPYGYKIPVTVGGKNICNPNSFTNTGKLLDGTNGNVNTNTNYKTTDYIFIKSGTYNLSLDNTYDGTGGTTTRMCLYNTSYGYTGNAVSDSTVRPTHPSYTFTVSDDCYYRLSVRNTDTNIQLEKSGTETTYEPYIAPRTTNIYLNEPLRKIDTYSDYIDFETQKVYRNVGNIELVKAPVSSSTVRTNTVRTLLSLKVTGGKKPNNTLTSEILCTHGNGTPDYYYSHDEEGICELKNATNPSIIVSLSLTKATTERELLNWLAANSVYLDFILDTPTEETITLPDILLNKGTNIISVGTSVQPSDMWIKYKGK